MNTFYIMIAVRLLRRVLPSLKKRALESQNQYDDSAVILVELALELYDEGKLTTKRFSALRSSRNI